jgi:hypothetical protein
MVEFAQTVLYKNIEDAAESSPGWFRTSMNIIVKCDRRDLKLRFANHFVEGGFVNRVPDWDAGYVDELGAVYISRISRKKFEGVFICQVQNEQEFPYDVFIMIGWEALRSGSVRIYTILVETERGEAVWDPGFMREQKKSFRGRLKTYAKRIEESWSLGNNTNIKLITELGGDKTYCLKITIYEDEPCDRGYLPIRIAPKR